MNVIYIVAAFFLLFLLQYILCQKTVNQWIRAIPFLVPLAALVGAIWFVLQPKGGFMDFSMLAALVLAIFALICLAAIILARVISRVQEKREKKKKADHE